MLSIAFIILCAVSSGALSAQGDCKDPNSIIDNFLQSVKQNRKHDSAELEDIEVDFSYGLYLLEVSLSDGQVYGIVSQAQRQGEAQSRHKQGEKCYVEARFYYPQLLVEYDDADIRVRPFIRLNAKSYKGYFYGVHAYLNAEYDESSGDLKVNDFTVNETSDAKFTLEGAERERRRYPYVENRVQYHIKKALSKAMKKKLSQAATEYSQISSK